MLEASERLGGALRTTTFGGRAVDLGPTASWGGDPRRSTCAARSASATTWCRSRRAAPRCGPAEAAAAARGPGAGHPDALLADGPLRHPRSPGRLGLARDAVLPRPDVRGPIGDRSVGPLVARKLGRGVVDTLVDPLMGGIHAGSVDDMSAAAVYPPLLAAAQRRGGLMRALRAEVPPPDPDGPPLFWALRGGMATLVDALAAAPA